MNTTDLTNPATQPRAIADYDLIRPLGEASHGDLWLAQTPQRLGVPEPHVVVKILRAPGTADDLTTLAEELSRPAGVPSPHLTQLLEAGHHEGRLYYVSRHLPDGSLAVPARPLSRVEVLRAVADAARGAHALHEVGFAHRDIRPGAIVLGPDGAQLGEFGMAQILNPGQTITGLGPVINIEYLAPEVVRGEDATRATDIWSLGATLHRSLTGRSIFPDLPEDSQLSALRHILSEPVTFAGPLSAGETEIITSCVSQDPVDRPPTALELAERISAEAARQEGAA